MKIDNPIVSIVTPVFNCQDYLSETIESIRNQSFRQWELILVDDASTDSSYEIAEQYANLDSRIHLVRLSCNCGPAFARNTAIEQAIGRYIAFCDSDDIWLPEKLAIQVRALADSDAAICFSSYYKMLENGAFTNRIVCASPVVNYSMMLHSNYIACSTAIYDTHRCTKIFMPDIIKRQDYGLWLRILSQGHTAIGLHDPLVHYRIRSNSVSSNKLKAAYYHWKVLRSVTGETLLSSISLFLQYAWHGVRKYRI